MSPDGGRNLPQSDPSASLDSGDSEDNEGLNIEERERHLAQYTLDEDDANLSLAFVNIHDRLADKT